ncbi:hypothetical protein CNMCM7691_005284 [Aspergillus felis]|uniref:Ubiquitin-conjugating enzyme E2-binding protein n=1 Tax=Aspergillus felis TaxID=1287682 RepID=A0A8H6V4F0_9EURO|nr:hypothetical protein CNMCM7691_005284 [Aspergillus felis]
MPAPPENAETDVDTSLYLHAELLPNIRHITLYISLPANLGSQNIQPLITVSETRQAVSVSLPKPFDHVTDTIKLPARVNEASRRILATNRQDAATTADRRREFSFRMQIDDSDASLPRQDALIDDFVPWTAADMSPSTRLRCRECENVVLDTPRCADAQTGSESTGPEGWTWKDLPSGNWAEMMDFWHCHKPDPPEGHGHGEDPNAQTKGYGAANQVVATAGTVLVDVATFLVSEADCRGLTKGQPPTEETTQKKEISLNCAKCNATIGIEDAVAQGWRLFKTSLSANISQDPSTWETHPIETIVAAQLLELIERESARRFVIHCDRPNGLLLWVFNPDFRYSSSSAEHTVSSQRAMKVLFQEVGNVDSILNPGTGSSLSLEEVRLPDSVYEAVGRELKARNEMLPASAREFREWRVGALHRFERFSLNQPNLIMPPSKNNTPRPWGSHCSGVTMDSTGCRDFIEGSAFMESDDEEGLAWQHVEDISILAPEEKDFSTGATGRNRENGFKSGTSGSSEASGSKKGLFGFGAKGKSPAGKK